MYLRRHLVGDGYMTLWCGSQSIVHYILCLSLTFHKFTSKCYGINVTLCLHCVDGVHIDGQQVPLLNFTMHITWQSIAY